MTRSIGYFSTDFSSEPVVDEAQSARLGRQVLVQGQKKVIFGGTYKSRGAMPAMELNKHGWDNHLAWQYRIAPDGHFQTMDLFGEWHDPDVFWSQRLMSRDSIEQVKRARAASQIVLSDLDDAFHCLPSSNIAAKTTAVAANSEFNRVHYWKMLAECNGVTTSTEPLRKEMERIGVPAIVVRNAIDIEEWTPNDPAEGTISWIGGINWRARDLQQLKVNRLPQFLKAHALQCYHGGDANDPSVPKFFEIVGTDPAQTLLSPLTHIADYPKLWGPVAISLVPLERCAFNEAKSWLKQLESCAAGVPYIVSAGFKEQELLLNEGTAGRVARNTKPSDWLEHLEDLLDPEVRRKEGAINRSVAERHDIRTEWKHWDAAYRQIMSL